MSDLYLSFEPLCEPRLIANAVKRAMLSLALLLSFEPAASLVMQNGLRCGAGFWILCESWVTGSAPEEVIPKSYANENLNL